jgi:hypothetical protein
MSAFSLPDMLFYDFDRVNQNYDDITFREWADKKWVSKPFYDIMLQPALSVTLNERENFSAAESIIIQLYGFNSRYENYVLT